MNLRDRALGGEEAGEFERLAKWCVLRLVESAVLEEPAHVVFRNVWDRLPFVLPEGHRFNSRLFTQQFEYCRHGEIVDHL